MIDELNYLKESTSTKKKKKQDTKEHAAARCVQPKELVDSRKGQQHHFL